MLVPAAMMWIVAGLYAKYTKDTPAGNFNDTGARHDLEPSHGHDPGHARPKTHWSALAHWPIAALTMAYAVCFGMEITFDNVAALHFVDTFHLSQRTAGFCAGGFGAMNLFARALGGFAADKAGHRRGMPGKGALLTAALILEGLGLIAFAHAPTIGIAIVCMLSFALFLKMANGAVYSIVPFIDKNNIGLISGVVGAGGSVGGMLFGLLFRTESLTYAQAFTFIGIVVLVVAGIIAFTRWKPIPASAPSTPSTAPAGPR
jgi:NNP family nitrate/nitrite transporter-like MFS transporter